MDTRETLPTSCKHTVTYHSIGVYTERQLELKVCDTRRNLNMNKGPVGCRTPVRVLFGANKLSKL